MTTDQDRKYDLIRKVLCNKYGQAYAFGTDNLINRFIYGGIEQNEINSIKAIYLWFGEDRSYTLAGTPGENDPDEEIIKRFAMTDNDLINVTPYIKRYPNLEYLAIESYLVTDVGISHLMNSGVFPSLKVLELSAQSITDNSAQCIATAINSCLFPNLVILNLAPLGYDSKITEYGRKLIEQSLNKIPHEIMVFWGKIPGGGAVEVKDKNGEYHDLAVKEANGHIEVGFIPSSSQKLQALGVSAGDAFDSVESFKEAQLSDPIAKEMALGCKAALTAEFTPLVVAIGATPFATTVQSYAGALAVELAIACAAGGGQRLIDNDKKYDSFSGASNQEHHCREVCDDKGNCHDVCVSGEGSSTCGNVEPYQGD